MIKYTLLKRRLRRELNRLVLVIDVDGVLTDGTFYYDKTGKAFKRFGPHDAEAATLLKTFFQMVFISADIRGAEISRLRLSDMGFPLIISSSRERQTLVENLQNSGNQVLLLADSISDIPALKKSNFSFCPNDSFKVVAKNVDFRLNTLGGKGTLAELYLILKNSAKGLKEFENF